LTAAHGNYIKVFDCVLNQNRLQTETDANEIDNEKEGKTERKAKTIESCYSGAIVFVFVFGIGIGIFEFRVVFVFGRGFRWFFWIYCVVGWLGLQRRGAGQIRQVPYLSPAGPSCTSPAAGKANVCQRKEKSLMVLQKSISRSESVCVCFSSQCVCLSILLVDLGAQRH